MVDVRSRGRMGTHLVFASRPQKRRTSMAVGQPSVSRIAFGHFRLDPHGRIVVRPLSTISCRRPTGAVSYELEAVGDCVGDRGVLLVVGSRTDFVFYATDPEKMVASDPHVVFCPLGPSNGARADRRD